MSPFILTFQTSTLKFVGDVKTPASHTTVFLRLHIFGILYTELPISIRPSVYYKAMIRTKGFVCLKCLRLLLLHKLMANCFWCLMVLLWS